MSGTFRSTGGGAGWGLTALAGAGRVLSLGLLLLSACSGTPGSQITQLDSGSLDTQELPYPADADASVPVDAVPPDLLDLSFDLIPPEVDLVDAGPACEPGSGCFLDPCTDNGQCLSGWCVEHLGEGVCTTTCQEECPLGWECQQYGGSGRDLMFACVSLFTNLCKPCNAAGDCIGPGGIQDACVQYGGGTSFCGGSCGPDTPCPAGFSCKEAISVSGMPLSQCLPDSGECACSAKSIALALSTPCHEENPFGSCTGSRVCTPEGLSACDAPAPAAEKCNGIDDDCDGQVDEPIDLEGVPVSLCNDDNPCTKDVCAGKEGCQLESLDGTECQDGDLCTAADHCQDGACVGVPLACDDDDPCTDDSCGPAGQCVHEANTAKCDDGNPCTVGDLCGDGKCAGVPVDCECTADPDCAKLDDDNLCNGTLFCNLDKFPHVCSVIPGSEIVCPPPDGDFPFCLKSECQPESGDCLTLPDHDGLACDDGIACTLGDACSQGVCAGTTPANCADDNPCTDDSCLPDTGCQHVPNSADCSDGNACTLADTCKASACVGGPLQTCDDGNPCTDDGCNPASGCTHTPNSAPCDDANACTVDDACAAGACIAGKAQSCDDANLCTNDACDPKSGCLHTMNSAPCDDGSVCTVNDLCQKGSCVGTAPLTCTDANPCTDDQCHPKDGCLFVPNSAPCDDGNACTLSDQCDSGQCKSKAMLGCNDSDPCTDDACEPAAGCVHTLNTAPCDDGNACTSNDQCAAGSCVAGPAIDCADDNPCTDDSCAPKTGCKHSPNQAPCDDGNACTVADQCESGQCKSKAMLPCNDSDPCTDDSCDPAAGCVHKLNTAPCDDGDVCTTGDKCAAGLCSGTGKLACDDSNPCTQDSCVSGQGCTNAPLPDGTACIAQGVCVGACKSAACEETAQEVCDGQDNDCDGIADEQDATGCSDVWPDLDGDGHGAGNPSCRCGVPQGYSKVADDCNDLALEVFPGAVEACNGVDDDCDMVTDPEGAAECTSFLLDADGDGYGKDGDSKCLCAGSVPYAALVGGDCQDGNPAINPGASESCTTAVDDNCDGKNNDGCIYGSCKELLAMTPGTPTGKRTIDPDGNGPVAPYAAWCDMTADGGGWTLIGIASNTGPRMWTSTSVFSDASTFGSLDQIAAAYKSPAWKQVPGKDFMVETEEYSLGYNDLLATQSMADFFASKWPGTCSSTWLHGNPDFTINLNAEQAKLFGFTLRGWDNNASCFPSDNENSAISLLTAECCWVNGIGNNTCCQPEWVSHDQSLLKKQFLIPVACNPAVWPCSPGGVTVNAYTGGDTECYGTSCKVPWARMYVR